jgi:hypothetical protein
MNPATTVAQNLPWQFGWTALAAIGTLLAAAATAFYARLVHNQLADSKTDRALTERALEMQQGRDEKDAYD